jgi:hypothetical protein
MAGEQFGKIKFRSYATLLGRAMAQASHRGSPGSIPGSVYVGFVMDKVALGQVFLRVLRFSPVNFIPPVLH